MPLLVKFPNDRINYVDRGEFQELLVSGKIEAFKRSSGDWIDPKVGPLRGQGIPDDYSGPERRARWQ